MNVILMTLESLRADKIEMMDDEWMPNFNKLIRNGFFFPNTITSTVFTKPSLASIFTSLFPKEHKVINSFEQFSNEKYRTIAEILSEQEVRTAGFVGYRGIGTITHFNRGYQYFKSSRWHDRFYGSLPAKILKAVSKKIYLKMFPRNVSGELVNKRFFNYVKRSLDKNKENFIWLFHFDMHKLERYSKYGDTDKEGVDHHHRIYEKALKHQDGLVGDLLTLLETEDLLKDTFLFMVGDHGESLSEREEFEGHGLVVYDELIKTPLIIYSPRIKEPRTIQKQVRTIDIAPTVLSLYGIDNDYGFEGQSLLKQNGELEDITKSYAISYCHPFPDRKAHSPQQLLTHSVRKYPWKLIRNHDTTFEFFNLEKDPLESNNIFEEMKESDIVKELLEVSEGYRVDIDS